MSKDNNKNSFVLYNGFYPPISGLSNEHLGELFRAIYEYQISGKLPAPESPINMAFGFFKNQFEVDDKKYLMIVERNKSNGQKGGRPKNPSKPKKPSGLSGNPKNPSKPKKADNDNDNDNDTVNDNVIDKERKKKKEISIYQLNEIQKKLHLRFLIIWA
jgi:hypothetical protein